MSLVSHNRVLVYGFYGHNNIGDQLFCSAFEKLFPNIEFIFTDRITISNIIGTSAIFIGGGSFLSNDPFISDECFEILKTKEIFYIGVGGETEIHPTHRKLLELSKLVALRSDIKIENIPSIKIPDLVYSLYNGKVNTYKHNKILVIPNICIVPNNKSEHWKFNSWNNFKFEFSQFLDSINCKIDFLSMCNNRTENDKYAACEIINSISNKDNLNILDFNSYDIDNLIDLFCKYDVIITQRYHGIILSEITKTPCITIHHHDKLKTSFLNNCTFQSYYSIDKESLMYNFNLAKSKSFTSIDLNIFDELKYKVNELL